MGIFESGAAIPLWILGAPLLFVIADAVMTPKVKPRDHYDARPDYRAESV
jgi:hypothetical protein